MRFAILTQYYPPEIGAPQARLSDLAERLVKAGHEVYVLTAMPNYPKGYVFGSYKGLYCTENRSGVRVMRTLIYPTKSLRFLPRVFSYISFTLSSLIGGVFLLPKVDYLMTESPPLSLGITGFFLSRIKKAKWIFNVSDLWPESAVRLGALKEGFFLKIAKNLEKFCYQYAWLVTGQSVGILEDIKKRFSHVETYLLSNGVDITKFSPEKKSKEARVALGDEDKCVALYAGLHGLAQGLDQLLEAAKNLKKSDLIKIVMIGDGPEKKDLIGLTNQYCLNNVEFFDPWPHEKMPSLLAASDIAVISLKGVLPGAVPSKIYEAMASSLPIIIIAEGEPTDIIQRAGCGVIVKPGNIEKLSESLANLAGDPKKRGEMGAKGLSFVSRYYNRAKIAEEFITFLEKDSKK